jgi:hypothetical protein
MIASVATSDNDINEHVTAATIDEKIAVVLKKFKEGPVLLFRTDELCETLKKEGNLIQ